MVKRFKYFLTIAKMTYSGKKEQKLNLVADFKCKIRDRNPQFFTYERSTETRLHFLISQKELDYTILSSL